MAKQDKPSRKGLKMTYRELLNILLQASGCELQQDVTVYAKELDEFHPVTHVRISGEMKVSDGILNDGHLYLEIEG